jgi:hypothetical protein
MDMVELIGSAFASISQSQPAHYVKADFGLKSVRGEGILVKRGVATTSEDLHARAS